MASSGNEKSKKAQQKLDEAGAMIDQVSEPESPLQAHELQIDFMEG